MSNHKIKRIRKMPDGNSIVLIWVFLLAQAGESNKSGALYFTDTIPYNPDGLAIQFDFPIDVIKLALNVLEKFEMIEIFEDIIYVKNWSEYQNIDGLERIREQTRLRVSKYKQNKKLLASGNVSGNATVTQGNATELDIEVDIDKEYIPPNPQGGKHTKFIPPTIIEISTYCTERKNNVDPQRYFDFYESKGWMIGKNKMKDWQAAVRTWEKDSKPKQSNNFGYEGMDRL
jgi:predicted phage replisome organizer